MMANNPSSHLPLPSVANTVPPVASHKFDIANERSTNSITCKKNVLLGATGSVASIKVIEIASELSKIANVHVCLLTTIPQLTIYITFEVSQHPNMQVIVVPTQAAKHFINFEELRKVIHTQSSVSFNMIFRCTTHTLSHTIDHLHRLRWKALMFTQTKKSGLPGANFVIPCCTSKYLAHFIFL